MKQSGGGNSRKTPYGPPLSGIVALASILYLLYYLWWRATATLNPDASFFSWVLVLAEAFGALSYILFSWMTLDTTPTRSWNAARPGISVDIFVPTYNESLDILEATLTGCRRVTYPHKTYVLDDGRRESVRQLADRMGCSYVARPTNEHAKAGNINYALRFTSGEFIVLLDADVVPQPGFIDRTLGYFQDEKLALVQLPQEFFNRDSIQHDQGAYQWHEQSLFFRVIQPGKNHSNSAFWCGSPSIVRRKALQDIGGVATDTITEDIHTSVRLHSRGWSSYFVNEPLAYGIAPETIQSFLVQRLRWAQGTMQLYRSAESPLWIPGLSIRQRISYLASFLAYFEAFQKLALILFPAFIIAFNVFPMKVGMVSFLARWIPYFAITILANTMTGRGNFRYLQTEKYNILKMVVFIQSTLTLVLQRALAFKVTPKSVDETVYRMERRSVRPFLVILAFLGCSVLYGLVRARAWNSLTSDRELYMIALAWAAYNAAIVLTALTDVLGKPHDRKHYRFRTNLEAGLYKQDASGQIASIQIRDLSIGGMGFISNHRISVDHGKLEVRFRTPYHQLVTLPLTRVREVAGASSDSYRYGASWRDPLGLDRARLFEYLFVYIPGKRLAPIVDEPRAPVGGGEHEASHESPASALATRTG